MQEDQQHHERRQRLRAWMADHKLTGRDVARSQGWSSAAHVTNLLRGHSPFGEKVARAIEQKLEMPPRWLDEAPLTAEIRAPLPVVNPLDRPDGVDDYLVIMNAVVALRDEMGDAFMRVTADRLAMAVALVVPNPVLAKIAANLLKL